ncbi:MAG: PilZ domain-containing protein [Spirochaetota bacterium]
MMLLLQLNPSAFWSQGENSSAWLGWVIGIVLVILVAVVAIIQSQSSPRARSSSGSSFDKQKWRQGAREVGLKEDEILFLEIYAKALSIGNAEATLRNEVRFEAFFKDAYKYIDKNSTSDAEVEESKATLFAIRERLSRKSTVGSRMHSTDQLGKGTPLSFITPTEESYPTIVVSSGPQGLAVEPIMDGVGVPIKFKHGLKVSCFFYNKAHQGFQFATKVEGLGKFEGRELLVLSHSETVSALPTRKSQRRAAQVPCLFFHVAVTTKKESGKNLASAKVDTTSFTGTVTDMSAGGMAIQSFSPFPAGDFIKVSLDPGGGRQTAFGKVVRINRLRETGGIMHVQFVKISRKSLNAIMSFVHGYSD